MTLTKPVSGKGRKANGKIAVIDFEDGDRQRVELPNKEVRPCVKVARGGAVTLWGHAQTDREKGAREEGEGEEATRKDGAELVGASVRKLFTKFGVLSAVFVCSLRPYNQ